jgi:hypothetical protein
MATLISVPPSARRLSDSDGRPFEAVIELNPPSAVLADQVKRLDWVTCHRALAICLEADSAFREPKRTEFRNTSVGKTAP